MPYFERINDWDSWFENFTETGGIDHGGDVYIRSGDYEKAISIKKKMIPNLQRRLEEICGDSDDPYNIKRDIQMWPAKKRKSLNMDLVLERAIAIADCMRKNTEKQIRIVELLEVPDIECFNKAFTKTESLVRDYLNNPTKHKNPPISAMDLLDLDPL